MQNLSSARHPKALWFLSASQLFYCVSIGATTSLLILYLIYKVQLSPHRAFETFAAMSSLIYILPLAGGYFGEKLGYILTICTGFVIVCMGFILLSVPEIHCMYIGIALFAAGNAFVVPNTNALVGLHYEEGSVLRNSGYTLYFLIYNVGFLISPLLAGFVSQDSDNIVFVISAMSVVIAFFIFIYFTRKVERQSGFWVAPQVHWSIKRRVGLLCLFAALATWGAWFLLHKDSFNDKFLCVLIVLVSIGLIYSAKKHDRAARLKMLVFLMLCILSVVFWSLYMLVPSFLTVFISQNINRDILGITFPPSCYYALDAFFVILLGFFFSWLWRYCAERKTDISLPAKFASSFLAIGTAYLILTLGVTFASQTTHLVSSLWIALAYALIAVSELFISPIALAMVGVLMPKGQEGLGMGIWQMFIGFSAIISGFLANVVAVRPHGNPIVTNPIYSGAFLRMGLCALVIGSVILIAAPAVKKFFTNERAA